MAAIIGIDPSDRYRCEFVIGVYLMLVDETCWFLAVDFDYPNRTCGAS